MRTLARVRSEDIGTDGELGEVTINVLDAMAAPPDKATVSVALSSCNCS